MLSGKKAYKRQSELKLRKEAHTSNFEILEMSRKKALFPSRSRYRGASQRDAEFPWKLWETTDHKERREKEKGRKGRRKESRKKERKEGKKIR